MSTIPQNYLLGCPAFGPKMGSSNHVTEKAGGLCWNFPNKPFLGMADVIGVHRLVWVYTNLPKPYSVVALSPPYLKKAYTQLCIRV